jgi:hypothetical protein
MLVIATLVFYFDVPSAWLILLVCTLWKHRDLPEVNKSPTLDN